jgi:hypothetical protein
MSSTHDPAVRLISFQSNGSTDNRQFVRLSPNLVTRAVLGQVGENLLKTRQKRVRFGINLIGLSADKKDGLTEF